VIAGNRLDPRLLPTQSTVQAAEPGERDAGRYDHLDDSEALWEGRHHVLHVKQKAQAVVRRDFKHRR